tara:strand:+ start:306 stop:998 length:693 start_codon:yes stop_codon:yes gene_type:complete
MRIDWQLKRYIETALSSIATLSTLVEDLTSNFINQAANLAVLQVEVEKIEGQISDIETQLELIDSTGDIASVIDLLYDLDDNIVENRYSITSLLNRISSLETESEKYNTDIIGCYFYGDYPFEILPNGIGFYQNYNSYYGNFVVTFIWEKVSGDDYKFVFPTFPVDYYDYDGYYTFPTVKQGTYIRTITSDTATISFPGAVYNAPPSEEFSIEYTRARNAGGWLSCLEYY